ncbi:MAG: AmmeMemoRadiSam system protein B [Syntrophaceae bacterium]|nr:AmmeMemoRadiSam system protein B [Syntrophaceae bacterium]
MIRKWMGALFLGVFLLGGAVMIEAGREPSGEVRSPAVAGQFYSDSPAALRLGIERYMGAAVPEKVKKPIALVLPHAGYIYSGQVAADGYNQARNQQVDVVILLGTNHASAGFRKVGLYPGRGFRTPLGIAEIDQDINNELLREDPDCVADKAVHAAEHSIEVQVPFVQVVFPKAKIVPALIGTPDLEMCTRFGQALGKVLKNRRALIVASSDLSHYPKAKDAVASDLPVLDAIITLDPQNLRNTIRTQMGRHLPNLHTCACGEGPIMAAMAAAKALGAEGGRVVSYAHSGDTIIGEQNRVVGYGAVVLTGENERIDSRSLNRSASDTNETNLRPEDKKALLAYARESITWYLTSQTLPLARDFAPLLQQPRGVFVTFKKRGQLRGCIGRLVPDMPLGKLVGTMALQSAFQDPRFSPVSASELDNLEVEISVLTPIKPVSGYEDIVVGRDGVVLSKDGHSAVFLPQVAPEQGWDRDTMLDHLSMKAGLSQDAWRQGAKFSTFQAIVFHEGEFE